MDKILVGLKRVVDYNVRVRVKSDGSGVETDGVKMSINPFDEIALEEALRIKERGEASEVIVMSIGAGSAAAITYGPRDGRGSGDSGRDRDRSRSTERARVFKSIIDREDIDLVIAGQTGDRRRQQSDRPNARGDLGRPQGDVCL